MPEAALQERASDSEGPFISDNVIRIQLREPRHRKWELSTRTCSPGRAFPTIQLFDCEGNILIETNDDNLSIKSTDVDKNVFSRRQSKSLGATDYARRQITIRKNNSVSGDKIYTRLFKRQQSNSSYAESVDNQLESDNSCNFGTNLNNLRIPYYGRSNSSPLSFNSPAWSEYSEFDNSSFKSSDNESAVPLSPTYCYVTGKPGTLLLGQEDPSNHPNRRRRFKTGNSLESDVLVSPTDPIPNLQLERLRNGFNGANYYTFNGLPIWHKCPLESNYPSGITKSSSCYKPKRKRSYKFIRRANTDVIPATKNQLQRPNYPIVRNMSFLDTYLKSLPTRNKEVPQWLTEITNHVQLREKSKNSPNDEWRKGVILTDDTDVTAQLEQLIDKSKIDKTVEKEIKRRLKKYHKVLSCSDYWTWKRNDEIQYNDKRRNSEGNNSSSSESFDEGDKVLMRLKRRILQNKKRERKDKRYGKICHLLRMFFFHELNLIFV